jgi:hypothetical protein
MGKVNRGYKASVFAHLFGEPEKERELTVFSSMPVGPDAVIEDCTITDVLFKDRVNDLSFTVDNRLLMFFEHQSTISNNLPIRDLLYSGRVYEKIVASDALYRTARVEIPTPEFIVLYNGIAPFPDKSGKKIYKLSEAFASKPGVLPLELIVTAYDINDGQNSELLSKCKTLHDYAVFIAKARGFEKDGASKSDAVEKAIDYCVNNHVLADYLKENGSEVLNMLLQEWNWDTAFRIQREEGRQEGMQEGMQQGMQQGEYKKATQTAQKMLSGGLSPNDVSKYTGLTFDEINTIISDATH